jgi:hypothetical protein
MKKLYSFLTLFFSIALLFGCSSDDDNTNTVPTVDFDVAIGSYTLRSITNTAGQAVTGSGTLTVKRENGNTAGFTYAVTLKSGTSTSNVNITNTYTVSVAGTKISFGTDHYYQSGTLYASIPTGSGIYTAVFTK